MILPCSFPASPAACYIAVPAFAREIAIPGARRVHIHAGTVSRAVQPAIHDVTDASALRSWFNPPLATSLSAELYKAQNIVQQFAQVRCLLT